jgi:hypothetical protein
MKKIIILSSIIVILFLSGCAQQGNNNPAGVIGGPGNFGDPGGVEGSIVGTWYYEDNSRETYYVYLTFSSNGSYSVSRYYSYWCEDCEEYHEDEYYENGTYSIAGNELTIYNEDYETTMIFVVYGNELWLYNDDGGYIIYERVYGERDIQAREDLSFKTWHGKIEEIGFFSN